MDILLLTLQTKAEDFGARSQHNNIRIVGVTESTNIDNMECYVEQILKDMLDQDTSIIFVVDRAYRMLGTLLIPEKDLRADPPPDSVIAAAARKTHSVALSSSVPPDKDSKQVGAIGKKMCGTTASFMMVANVLAY
ncbi:hypothetical protein NDU88_001225 [Pleurodeles waltl]|uniref:Uncharacterized protein n=1 Tax=Pleurodeles waltl TaxID=8319 RepID=A0AAV7THP4_PLEWA|nr:hypothetical protein NDU88_001225 [Pleurodeles waltl]